MSVTLTEIESSATFGAETHRIYASGEKYILPVDQREGNRLELQHKVLKNVYEGQVLLAPHEKNSSYFVLESGVGTGAWLLDLASELPPTAILHGIDIDDSRLPTHYPANISFSVGSVLALPEAWSDRFDFVHQRLLTCALTYTDWQKALVQLRKVICSGGWVQLGEYGRRDADIAAEDEAARPASAAWVRTHRALYAQEGLLFRAYEDLPPLLREAGFVDVRIERRNIPLGEWAGEQGRDAAENLIVFYRALKARMLKTGGLGSEAELDQMIEGVRREWDSTPGAETDFYIMCAQKAP